MTKYCEYCGCEAKNDMIKCGSCGAPFTKNSKNIPADNVLLYRGYEDTWKFAMDHFNSSAKIKGLKPGRI